MSLNGKSKIKAPAEEASEEKAVKEAVEEPMDENEAQSISNLTCMISDLKEKKI